MSTDLLPKRPARLTVPGFGIALLVGVLYLLPFSLLLPADQRIEVVATMDGGASVAGMAAADSQPTSFRLASSAPCPKARGGADGVLLASP